ncbi:MAG TPA: imidazole glycerol phosphate synthase subunit HisH [Bacteroidia bacterium]|jgi:glutamine amidotransferase|nr:imidazole glycerol phosphate synthase subunit HisH [Bacteroidia bacterium]
MSGKIAIINYGIGNLTSVQNALKFVGYESSLIDKASDLKNYDKFILPGVGAFGAAMQNLKTRGFVDELYTEVLTKEKPILGLCLGMQLFFSRSDENGLFDGLNWIDGEVKSLKKITQNLSVPHMGWNEISPTESNILLKNITPADNIYYFVHSYACFAEKKEQVLATTTYGATFDVMINQKNIFGCQFHPEKSQKSGLQILKNYVELC